MTRSQVIAEMNEALQNGALFNSAEFDFKNAILRWRDALVDELAAGSPCQRCGAVADAEIHYVGTVDSHEFEAAGTKEPR